MSVDPPRTVLHYISHLGTGLDEMLPERSQPDVLPRILLTISEV